MSLSGNRLAARPQQLSVQASPVALAFPPGATINGSFVLSNPSTNYFDPDQVAASGGFFSVPSGVGNSAGPNNVAIKDDTAPEFATVVVPVAGCAFDISVDVTRAGLVTYSVQFQRSPSCDNYLASPAITLVSPAFSGCSLRELPGSTFPAQGGGNYNNTVTGRLQGDAVSLTAEYLSYNAQSGLDSTSLSASWQLEGCPAVRTQARGHYSNSEHNVCHV